MKNIDYFHNCAQIQLSSYPIFTHQMQDPCSWITKLFELQRKISIFFSYQDLINLHLCFLNDISPLSKKCQIMYMCQLLHMIHTW